VVVVPVFTEKLSTALKLHINERRIPFLRSSVFC